MRSWRGLALFTFGSGAAGLVYQSLWLRAFGLVFGNTTDAVASVLAVFMGGLALGSALAARRPAARPLRTYALVEMGIAGTALLSAPLLAALPRLYGRLAAAGVLSGPAEVAARVLGAALVVLPATVLMGLTVPLLVEAAARRRAGFAESFGGLYLVNTLGGATGVVLSAFVLVPWLGTDGTIVVAALANLLIGAAAWRWAADSAEAPTAARAWEGEAPGGPPPLALGLALASGVASFALEVLWTRSFALVIGSSVYAFNAMLTAFLAGLVLGALVHQRFGPRLRRPALVAGGTYLAVAALALGSVVLIGWLPVALLAAMKALPVSFPAHQAAGFLLCFFTMLPVTVAFGFTFPLLSRLGEGERPAQRASGLLYAWNTAGAIAGALAADLLLVPRLGLQRSYPLVAAVAVGAGLAALLAARGPGLRLGAALLGAGATASLAAAFTPWDPLVISAGVYKYGLEWKDTIPPGELASRLAEDRRLLFYEEGVEAVVAVTESRQEKRRFLSINGKTDAGSGAEDVLTQKYLAHVPLLLHPRPRRVLVIGWGAGATAASAALHEPAALDCVEIEPATFRAAGHFEELSGALRRDPRFRVSFRDARNQLLGRAERYDVIVSEPSNPWISGVSNLFTREFYEVARERLAEGGLFGQWFHYYNLREEDVKVELRTFLSVFPQASLWLVPPVVSPSGPQLGADLLLVGSLAPHRLEAARLRAAFAGRVGADLRETRSLTSEAALLATFALDRPDLARWAGEGPPLNTDAHPVLEFEAPRSNVATREEVVRATLALYQALGSAGAALLPPFAAPPAEGATLGALFAELATEHQRMGLAERAFRDLTAAAALAPDAPELQTRLAEALMARGQAAQAEPHLLRALEKDPTRLDAFDLLGGLYLDRHEAQKAEAVHREMIKHHPRYVAGRLRFAGILARRGAWKESRDELLAAQQLDPKAPVDPKLLQYLELRIASEQ